MNKKAFRTLLAGLIGLFVYGIIGSIFDVVVNPCGCEIESSDGNPYFFYFNWSYFKVWMTMAIIGGYISGLMPRSDKKVAAFIVCIPAGIAMFDIVNTCLTTDCKPNHCSFSERLWLRFPDFVLWIAVIVLCFIGSWLSTKPWNRKDIKK